MSIKTPTRYRVVVLTSCHSDDAPMRSVPPRGSGWVIVARSESRSSLHYETATVCSVVIALDSVSCCAFVGRFAGS